MKKKLYLRTEMDEYELPIAVADSPRELAAMVGSNRESVNSSISKKKT